LDWCKKEGVKPEKPHSGKFNVRLSPELHRKIAISANKMHLSINNFVEKALEDELKLINLFLGR
jgi:predicted HicB family RNase H-like nuclease